MWRPLEGTVLLAAEFWKLSDGLGVLAVHLELMFDHVQRDQPGELPLWITLWPLVDITF